PFTATPTLRDPRPFPTRRSSDLVTWQKPPTGRGQRLLASKLPRPHDACHSSLSIAEAKDPLSVHDSNKTSFRRSHAVMILGFAIDRKSTRLNSSHVKISYAVFCL